MSADGAKSGVRARHGDPRHGDPRQGDPRQGEPWSTSAAPLAVVAGLLFLIPGTFECYAVYDFVRLAAGFAVLGFGLLSIGVILWTAEGLARNTRVHGHAAVGISIFIVAVAFIFFGLFISLWSVHLRAESWPPAGTPEMSGVLALLMLALMVAGAVAVLQSGLRHQRGDLAGFRAAVWTAVLLGTLVLGLRVYEYGDLLAQGFTGGSNSFSACFYVITGFHALNLLALTAAYVLMAISAMRGRSNPTFVAVASVYWVFLTVMCLFMVTQVYFWD